jgi:hypothetical protein
VQIHWDNPGFDVAREASMSLEDPQALTGSDGAGRWTMTYDEGFDFSMGDNSVRLLPQVGWLIGRSVCALQSSRWDSCWS